MKPSIKAGDVVLYYRIDKRYKAGDTVIVSYKGEDQVRRVAAIAGDTVDISEDGLTINGSIQQEADIYEDTLPYKKGIKYPVTLKEGEVFLLGDKRSEAVDSRLYGAVKVSDTKGKVMLIIRRWGI